MEKFATEKKGAFADPPRIGRRLLSGPALSVPCSLRRSIIPKEAPMVTVRNTLDSKENVRPDERARFYDPENFFAFQFPPVPRRQFTQERDLSLIHI